MAEEFKVISSGSVVFEGRGGNALVFNNDGDILLTNGLETITPNDNSFISLNKNENQVVLSAGVLKLNARETDIYINASKYISLSAGESIHFDIGPINTDNEANRFLVNAPRIEFTTIGKGRELVPVARGTDVIDTLHKIMDALNLYSKLMVAAASQKPIADMARIALNNELKLIGETLENINSDLTYTQ